MASGPSPDAAGPPGYIWLDIADHDAMANQIRNNDTRGLVLIVDDDVVLCELQRRWLEQDGYDVAVEHDGTSALSALSASLPDVVCLDLSMPGMDGFEVLERIKAHQPRLPVIVTTAQTGARSAVRAMKLGAYDYLIKPVEQVKLLAEVRHAVERSQLALRVAQLEREAAGTGYPGIVGQSPPILELFRRMDRIALSDITVLITGESGTGKELVARAIHQQSARAKNPFVALSCAAIPESLQESELFGHEKGSFTGATARRAGCFERADRGTLFLDEIGELSPSLQAKLLRVLQERTFLRVGGSAEIHSDFRLIVATHRDLAAEVRAERFREDLYFRVTVMDLEVPPLRARKSDIPLLARHFLRAAVGSGDTSLELGPGVLSALQAYDWPGNVRELQNAIERAGVEAEGGALQPHDLPKHVRRAVVGTTASPVAEREDSLLASMPRTLEEMERDAIAAALARTKGNIAQVVRELGVGRTTLYRKIKKYALR